MRMTRRTATALLLGAAAAPALAAPARPRVPTRGFALPGWLARFIDMPDEPLPGDGNLPRVAAPGFGASERLDVSPGHENRGIFHMPGGPSDNPLSPFFGAGHEDWVKGRPAPFLPGPASHTLVMQPAR